MPREHSVNDLQDDDDHEDTLWRKQASFPFPLESQRSKDGGAFQACFKHLHQATCGRENLWGTLSALYCLIINWSRRRGSDSGTLSLITLNLNEQEPRVVSTQCLHANEMGEGSTSQLIPPPLPCSLSPQLPCLLSQHLPSPQRRSTCIVFSAVQKPKLMQRGCDSFLSFQCNQCENKSKQKQ